MITEAVPKKRPKSVLKVADEKSPLKALDLRSSLALPEKPPKRINDLIDKYKNEYYKTKNIYFS